MPMFVISKKDGSICTVDNLHKLNKQFLCKQYPLPKIKDIFHRHRKYKYFTKLDLSQCYYTHKLDDESSWLCTLVTPLATIDANALQWDLVKAPIGLKHPSNKY